MKIAISGKMCSGKSTLKEFLKDKILNCYNTVENNSILPLQELSFGHPIKEMYYSYFNWSSIKDRRGFQSIGDAFRDIDRDVFAKRLIDKIEMDSIVIVDDLRFKNEMKYLKENGFITIRIEVAEDIQRARFYKLYPGQDYTQSREHISENDLDNCRHFSLIIGQDENDYNTVWNYIVKNHKDELCKILFKNSAVDDYENLNLYTPCKDILTGDYVHQNNEWHSDRQDIYNNLNNV